MSPYDKAPTRLSTEAAQAIYDKIAEQDSIIDNAMNEISLAASSIAFQTQNANAAYQKRAAMAGELGQLAAEDFTPNRPLSPMAAPVAPGATNRFYRNPPFPSSRVYNGRPRERQQEMPGDDF